MAELIIVFREVLEASLIVGILYTFLKKTDQQDSIKRMWQGVVLALILSIIGSFAFQKIAGGFQGKSEKLFEGFVMIIAAIILSTVIVWMGKNKNIAEDLKNKAESALSSSKVGLGIFILAFISVFREGIETILFLYGVMMKEGGLSISLSLIGAVLGIGVGYLIFVQGKKVPLKTFFNVSSILLIFVAGGMFAYGIHELESAGLITDYGRVWDINPAQLEDGSYPLLHDKGFIGGLFKGLFGYNGNPSMIELLSWFFCVGGLFILWKKSSVEPSKS